MTKESKIIPEYIDCHAHVNFSAYDNDRGEVLKSARENNTWIINVGTKQETSASAVAMAEGNDGVYAIIGLHPVHVNPSFHDKDELGGEGEPFKSKGEDFDYDFYAKLAAHPKVVAIGECGLDFYREQGATELKRQEEAFRKQIELSVEFGKPLMLHIRNAYKEALAILREYPGAYGNAHFFAGTEEEAKEFLDLGFTLSFTGVVTFAKDYEKLVKFVPLNMMLSETDCPYVSPVPHRGKRNEPAYVKNVVEAIAKIKGEEVSVVKKTLIENAFRLFKL